MAPRPVIKVEPFVGLRAARLQAFDEGEELHFLAQTARGPEAVAALQQAEQLAPNVADYPYARATVLWQLNDRPAALAAARRALEIDPSHGPSRAFLQQANR